MSKLRKALRRAGEAIAYAAAFAVSGCVALAAKGIWDNATPAGQISSAIIGGCALIAGAVWLASRRPPANVTVRCDAVEGMDLAGVGGNVYLITPNATRVQGFRHTSLRSSTPQGQGERE